VGYKGQLLNLQPSGNWPKQRHHNISREIGNSVCSPTAEDEMGLFARIRRTVKNIS